MITTDTISVDASEAEFITIHYVQLDNGIDMGGRLVVERQSLALLVELMHSWLTTHDFSETERQCGNDNLRFYGSGSDQQSFYNILNRRPDGVSHSGLSGLMMTEGAAEDLVRQLLSLATESDVGLVEVRAKLDKQFREAAAQGNLDAMKLALLLGADVNGRGDYGDSALNLAAEHGQAVAVEVLIKLGADLENLGGAQKTPLMNAAFAGQVKVVELLLGHGALINRDLLNTLQLKVDIFEENTEAGMVMPGVAEAWRRFLDFMIVKWQEQNARSSS